MVEQYKEIIKLYWVRIMGVEVWDWCIGLGLGGCGGLGLVYRVGAGCAWLGLGGCGGLGLVYRVGAGCSWLG